MSKDFDETEAATVDVSLADEKPLNAGELLNTVFQVFDVKTGVSEKTGREWGRMKVYAEELYCIESFKPNGDPIYSPKQCWMSPHMILQSARWNKSDFPVRCGLIFGDNNAYIFCAPSKVVKREASADVSL